MLWDFRLALRGLARTPLFALIAIGTLALGIGASTAMFAVVDGALLRPLPFADAERVVSLLTRFEDEGRQIPRIAGGDWPDLAAHPALAAVAAYTGGEIGVQLGSSAEFTQVQLVTPGFFGVFGVEPTSGRWLQPQDADAAAVVSSSFANRNYGGIPNALGNTLAVDGTSYEIVGVMPPAFSFPNRTEVWLAIPEALRNRSRTAYNYRGVARLAGGVTLSSADQQLGALAESLRGAHREFGEGKTFRVIGLRELTTGSTRPTLLLLMGSVVLVLLVACANVANLYLARVSGRTREMAVRGAMGASGWRIVRQLLAEGLVVASFAAACGLAIAYWATAALVRFIPDAVRLAADVRVDERVFLFAMTMAVASALLFALAPAWQAMRTDLRSGLAMGAARSVLGGQMGWLRGTLVVAEIALAMVLALGAGVLFRSMLALQEVDMGVRQDGLLVMYAHEPAQSKEDYQRVAREISTLPEELKTLPGVESAASVMGLPAGRYGSNGGYIVVGKHSFEQPDRLPQANFALASPGYFETAGIRLLRGRDFSHSDLYHRPFVAIISEQLARESFPGEDPLGRQIVCGLDSPNPMTIVGIVSDVRQDSPAGPMEPHLYMPLAQHPTYANEVQVLARSRVSTAALAPALRELMNRRNPATSVKFTTMRDIVADSVAMPRFRTVLSATFALLVLLLAAAGIYGVMAFAAGQRVSEMGLRQALGATASDVWRLFMGNAARLALIGVVAGGVLFFLASRLLERLVFGITPLDPWNIAAVTVLMAMMVLLAAAAPAMRAARVDPVVALRDE